MEGSLLDRLSKRAGASGGRGHRSPNDVVKAVASRDVQQIREAIQSGGGADEKSTQGYAPIHIAAMLGRVDIIKVLLDEGASAVVEYTPTKMTPLHIAASYGRTRTVQILLEARASPEQPDLSGTLPVHLAAEYDHRQVVEQLLDTARKEDICGQTAMHIAAARSSLSTLQLLIDEHFEVDVVDARLRSPLHVAAAYCALPALAMLVSAGAKCHERDMKSCTPLDIARGLNSDKFKARKQLAIDLLKEYEHHPDNVGSSPLLLEALNYRDDSVESYITSRAVRPGMQPDQVAAHATSALFLNDRAMNETLTLREMESCLSDIGIELSPPDSEDLFTSLTAMEGDTGVVGSDVRSGRVSRLNLTLEVGACCMPPGMERLKFCWEILYKYGTSNQPAVKTSKVLGRAVSPVLRRRYERQHRSSSSHSIEVGEGDAEERPSVFSKSAIKKEEEEEELGLPADTVEEVCVATSMNLISFCRRRCNPHFESLDDVKTFFSNIASLNNVVQERPPSSFEAFMQLVDRYDMVRDSFLRLREALQIRTKTLSRKKSTLGRSKSMRGSGRPSELTRYRSSVNVKSDIKEMRKAFREECNRLGVSTRRGVDADTFASILSQIGIPVSEPHDLFRALDRDDSGKLSLSEFARGLGVLVSGDDAERASLLFEVWDTDSSGKLSVKELEKGLRDILSSTYTDEDELEDELASALESIVPEGKKFVTRLEYQKGVTTNRRLKDAILGR